MIKPISEQQYKKAWKEWEGSPLQSWSWGELKSKYDWKVERLGVFENENLVAVVFVLIHTFPYSAITKLLGFEKFAYIPRGPVINDVKRIGNILSKLSEYYKEKVAFILIDPENKLGVSDWNKEFKEALLSDGWMVRGTTIQPNQTDIIDISKSEEEMMAVMRPKWRRNIRKAVRQGVSVSEVTGSEGIEKFYKVLTSVEKHTKFVAHDLDYFKNMREELSKEELVKIFVAEYKCEVVAADLVLVNEVMGYEIYGGATLKGRDCEASYLLKWEIMKRLAGGGKRFYDQWGVAPKGDESHPLTGISYFKSGFGGKYTEFLSQYVKVFNSIGYRIYKFRKS
ncbi:peptidoglycan bridge formation glycyltransferase FemA/FemB family protein [Candidatus Dojkabacteria bacterium]|nr:peptidoglycan bridge formation glycyltransferase FemA/FemB family protein [Candidatus Dojkabacteria bacterium]